MSPAPIPTGDRFVYRVASNTKAGRYYLIDLVANGGLGECSCKDWQTRRGPAGRAGGSPGTRAVLCRHLITCRRHFLNQLFSELARYEDQSPL